MIIRIRSEIDSRVLLYPLLRCIFNYGSTLVVTTNPMIKRLIDGKLDGEWRNISVVVAESGNTDDIFEEQGIALNDYDFTILDNMGSVEYDYTLFALGKYHSEEFEDEVAMVYADEPEKTKLVQFGKPPQVKKEKRDSKEPAKYEFFQTAFPTYEDFETVEGTGLFPKVDTKIGKLVYSILKDTLGISENIFMREVGKKDESSGNIYKTNTLWEN